MYCVKDISELLEVSRQTVYNYLKEHSKELKDHIIKKKGTTYIDDDGLTIIKKAMGLIQVPTVEENDVSIDDIVQSIQNGLIENQALLLEQIKADNILLKEQIQADNLKIQLEHEERLDSMESKFSQEIQDLKIQNQKLLESLTEKRGFWDRIFNK